MADFEGWKKALKAHDNVRFKSYPKLNHLFMEGEGKSKPIEYFTEGHASAVLIDDIVEWIKKLLRRESNGEPGIVSDRRLVETVTFFSSRLRGHAPGSPISIALLPAPSCKMKASVAFAVSRVAGEWKHVHDRTCRSPTLCRRAKR